jgi:hypothetical protein
MRVQSQSRPFRAGPLGPGRSAAIGRLKRPRPVRWRQGRTRPPKSRGSSGSASRIRQREPARRTRDWATRSRTRLNAVGVRLFDRDREWRAADGWRGAYNSPPPLRSCAARPSFRAGRRAGVGPLRVWRGFPRSRGRARWTLPPCGPRWSSARRLGRRGTERPRTRSGRSSVRRGCSFSTGTRSGGCPTARGTITARSECTLSDAQIADLIARWEQTRSAKDWPTSDGINQELRDGGVEVFDKQQRLWKAVGGRSGPGNVKVGPARARHPVHRRNDPAIGGRAGISK